jgi:hypothetical protein
MDVLESWGPCLDAADCVRPRRGRGNSLRPGCPFYIRDQDNGEARRVLRETWSSSVLLCVHRCCVPPGLSVFPYPAICRCGPPSLPKTSHAKARLPFRPSPPPRPPFSPLTSGTPVTRRTPRNRCVQASRCLFVPSRRPQYSVSEAGEALHARFRPGPALSSRGARCM